MPEPGEEIRRAWSLRILAGVIVAVGLATGAVVVAHPFSHGSLTAAKSVTTPPDTSVTSVASASSGGSAPASSPATASSPSAPSISRRQAATNLTVLLRRSGSERQAVIAAFSDAVQCGPALRQDAQSFRAAATSHRQLLSELAQLPGLSVLPSAVRQDLSAAWQASASADGDYARWVQDQLANGCTSSDLSDPNYTAASAPNRQATTSKTAFVQLWNPLARAYGLPTYSQSDL